MHLAPQPTVRVAGVAVTSFSVAPIDVDPMPVVKASPVLLIIATAWSDEVQVTCWVRFSVDRSLKDPCAENC